MPYVTTEVEVFVDMENLTDEELLSEIENRDFVVIHKSENMDKIYNLYREYISNENFEQELKKFFETELGILVA